MATHRPRPRRHSHATATWFRHHHEPLLPARELSPAAGETAGETGSPPQGRGELILWWTTRTPAPGGRELLEAHGYQVATRPGREVALALAGARIKELPW